jgi:hypothetical protein
MTGVTDALSSYLSNIDAALLGYLDDAGQLPVDVVVRLHRFAGSNVEGSATTDLVADEWPDFYDLASGFVVAYGSPELQALYDQANLEAAVATGRLVPVEDADRVLLVQLTDELEAYPGFPELQPD